MSAPAYYLCPTHGRVRIRTAGRAEITACCPSCGAAAPRAPSARADERHISVPYGTYARIKACAEQSHCSMGAVIDAATKTLGGDT